MIPLNSLSLAASILFGLSACAPAPQNSVPEDSEQVVAYASKLHEKQVREIGERFPNAIALPSGLHYFVNKEGSGEPPKRGKTVYAHYEGKLLNGQVFDSSYGKKPISFRVGRARVIKGWDEALLAMKPGEKRTLIIPSKLAYGRSGAGLIPPNAILIFEVELLRYE